MSGATAARATHERQVRSMFDRIAGRYDAMNSVMSAGLHHRWRARAVDMARRRARGVGARRLLRHGRPRARAARRVGPAGRVVGLDFSAPMLELAERKSAALGRGGRVGAGQRARAPVRGRDLRRGDGRLRRAQRRRPRARDRRDGARRAPRRQGGDPRDHDAAAPAAEVVLLGLVRPHRAAARHRGRRPRGLHLPAQLGAALPARARARRS